MEITTIISFLIAVLVSMLTYYGILLKSRKFVEEVNPYELPLNTGFALPEGWVVVHPDASAFVMLHEFGHINYRHPELLLALNALSPLVYWVGWVVDGWSGVGYAIVGWTLLLICLRIIFEIQADYYAAKNGAELDAESLVKDYAIVGGKKAVIANTTHLSWLFGYPPVKIREKLNQYWLRKYGYH